MRWIKRIRAWWRRGSIWDDHGHWSYTTMAVTRGPRGAVTDSARPAPTPAVKPVRSPAAEFNAHLICRKLGHTVHGSWCLICYALVGDLTVDDVVPPKVQS
ncbi:MAG TPA: hypothetical protein VNG12_27785 [Acidimicrobiales bacterium]|nr:hypothetical protein [Acidimicrobiales bacterium]